MQLIRILLFGAALSSALSLAGMPDTLHICRGESLQLSAPAGYATYRWSPSSGLSNPTVPDPVASPQSTTTYIVEAIPSSGQNLIVNGNFNNGNIGFSSQYLFSPGANPTQGVYGIFPDANQLSPMYFEHCRDRSMQNGLIMVVDGSPTPDQRVWCQTIQVTPERTYAFSTWLTSILQPNPAALRFSINGLQIGQTFVAGVQNCQWRQFYELWESGTATEAEICIVNRNTNPNGNDFALDDFAFFEIGDPVLDTVVVVVHEQPVTVIDTTFCEGQMIEYQGLSVPVSASFSLAYTSRFGCDSTVHYLAEIIDTVTVISRVDTLCPGETLLFRGHLITRDTLLCETVSAQAGCDTTFCLQAVFLTETALLTDVLDPTCFGLTDGSIGLVVQAGLPPFSYRWENGWQQPDRAGLGAGSYQVAVTDSKGCRAVKSIVLTDPAPLLLSPAGSSSFCNGTVNGIITLEASGGVPPYRYSIDDGQSFQAGGLFSMLAPGGYELVLEDAHGCSVANSVAVPAPVRVTLNVPLSSSIRLGEVLSVSVTDNSPQPLQYEWIPAEGVACPQCAETQVQPLRNTLYTIRATDAFGCSVEAFWQVEVTKEEAIFFPNAFSPNGDGVNDDFRLYPGLGVAEILDFSIFDRWGNLLHRQESCAADCAWDGIKDGQPLGRDVYVFLARMRYLDGEVVMLSGEVVLMR